MRAAAVLTLLVLLTGAAPAAAAEMPWKVQSRFGGDADGDGRLDRPTALSPADLDLFAVMVEPDRRTCDAIDRGVATWTVDGRPATPATLLPAEDAAEVACRAVLHVRGEGKHAIEVRAPSLPAQQATPDVDDRLVIAIGDSVASGEGNPGTGPRWLDAPCHRSPAAAFEQAARLLAGATEVRSLTFVSLACSGAEVEEGLLARYGGVAPEPGVTYDPQVERVARLRAERSRDTVDRGVFEPAGRPAVDAILVSIGANDIHFSKVVQRCAGPGNCIDAEEARVRRELTALSERYDRLGTALGSAAPRTPILITEYFDPTHDARGDFCRWSIAGTRREEAQWAYESLLVPLNIEVAAAARRNGWTRVTGIADAFERHGYCAPGPDRWVRTLEESLATQRDVSGTLHPNGRGHLAMAELVAPKLAQALRLDFQPRGQDGDASRARQDVVRVAGEWAGRLLLALVLGALLRLLQMMWKAPPDRRRSVLTGWLAWCAGPLRLLRGVALRLWHLFTAGRASRDPYELVDHPQPTRQAVHLPRTLRGAAIWTVAALLGGLVLFSLVGVVGGAMVWVRFWSARLPPDQAVDSVARSELAATGAGGMVLFAVLGLAAVALAAVLDRQGKWGRPTRRGLVVVIVAELLVIILVEDYTARQRVQLLAGFVLGAALLYYVVDRALTLVETFRRGGALVQPLWERVQRLLVTPRDDPGAARMASWLVPAALVITGIGAIWLADDWNAALYTTLVVIVLCGLFVLLIRLEASPARWKFLLAGIVFIAGLALATWMAHASGGTGRVVTVVLWMAAVIALRVMPKAALYAWRTVPLVLLGLAVLAALELDGPNRMLAPAAIVLATLLFIAPAGVGRAPSTQPTRIALAVSTLLVLVVLLARDELWLAGAAAIAAALAALCLAVAAASGQRFAPYGLAILLAVPAFGAAAEMLRNINSPELQPFAAVLTNGKSICGAYVGERRGRIWVARVELAELGHVRRPQPRRGQIFPVPLNRIADRAIGPEQPVARAHDQALELRTALLTNRGLPPSDNPSCFAPHPTPPVEDSPHRRLAERFQPELVVDRRDGFWPVPVRTLFSMQDRRARACRLIADDDSSRCVRLTSQGQFPWSGGEGEAIDYPAANNERDEQHAQMVDALGSLDPARTASIYFLRAGEEGDGRPVTLQYWFFYPFNYQPLNSALKMGAGFHEGDFESVGVLLSARTHRPRYVWMARHADEHRIFAWEEEALRREGDHVVAFAARGSHATYESCSRQTRFAAPGGLIDDRPTCEPARQLHLRPEATPMTDLSRVAWGCWRGLFGHRRGKGYESIPHLVTDAPVSPLWQQDFGRGPATPCAGVDDPGGRDGLGEEVVEEETKVPARLRRGAGRLEALVDDCADWEVAPADGTYMVACDQDALRRYAESGFEVAGGAGVRIDRADVEQPDVGEPSLPAVRRDAANVYIGRWQISTLAPTKVSVFASCRHRGAIVQARFPDVELRPGAPLRVDDKAPRRWRLRADDGTTVAAAVPRLVAGDAPKRRRYDCQRR